MSDPVQLSPLTPNELAVFTAIKKWETKHFPIGPRRKDIQRLSGIKSNGALHDAVKELVRKGYAAEDSGNQYSRKCSLRTVVKLRTRKTTRRKTASTPW
jgi:hypothetical protein